MDQSTQSYPQETKQPQTWGVLKETCLDVSANLKKLDAKESGERARH